MLWYWKPLESIFFLSDFSWQATSVILCMSIFQTDKSWLFRGLSFPLFSLHSCLWWDRPQRYCSKTTKSRRKCSADFYFDVYNDNTKKIFFTGYWLFIFGYKNSLRKKRHYLASKQTVPYSWDKQWVEERGWWIVPWYL